MEEAETKLRRETPPGGSRLETLRKFFEGDASSKMTLDEADTGSSGSSGFTAYRRRKGKGNVICLCLGAYRKPIFLVLHLKIKLFSMFFITIDLVGKYRTQATARRRSRERTLSWTNWLVH